MPRNDETLNHSLRRLVDLTPGPSPGQQRVLDVAATLARPGEPLSPKTLAEALGEEGPTGYSRVSAHIQAMKRKHLWPYASPKDAESRRATSDQTGTLIDADDILTHEPNPAAQAFEVRPVRSTLKDEIDAMSACSWALEGLDDDARRRVWRHLADHYDREES